MCVLGGGGDYRNSDHKFIVRYGSSLEMLATRVKNLIILSSFPEICHNSFGEDANMPWVFMTYLWGSVSSAVVDCCCTIVIVCF